MAKKDKGFCLFYRSLFDHWLWTSSEPFCRRAAWVDLVLMANHEDKEIMINGNPVTIKRGQLFTSEVKLASRWHWSRDKAHRYLHRLATTQMIQLTAQRHGTLLTLVNYGFYQDGRTTNRTTDRTSNKATDKAADQAQTNNVSNNVSKNEYNSASRRKETVWQ